MRAFVMTLGRSRFARLARVLFPLILALTGDALAQGRFDPFAPDGRAGFDPFGLVVAEAPGGVVVQAVLRGSAADGRLDVFDVIRRVDDVNVRDEVDFDRLTRRAPRNIRLLVWRSKLKRDELVILPGGGPVGPPVGGVPPSESMLGIRYDFNDDLGITIRQVLPGTPAVTSGLRPGMNLVEINGAVMSSPDLLEEAVAAGGRLRMRLFDRNRNQWTSAVADIRQQPLGGRFEQRLGVSLGNLDQNAGVIVLRVDPLGPAAAAGVQDRDILAEINGQRIRNLDDVRRLGPLDARSVRLTVRSIVSGNAYGPRVDKIVRWE